MSDRLQRMGDDELAAALTQMARRVVWPDTPDVAAAVSARLTSQPAPRRLSKMRRIAPHFAHSAGRFALAAAALAVVAAGVMVSSQSARDAVADWLGIGDVRVRVGGPTPAPAGRGLVLGERVTLEQARARAPFDVAVPSAAGFDRPDEVYFGARPVGGQVALVYGPRPGVPEVPGRVVAVLLTQFRGDLDEGFFQKSVGRGTRLRFTEVGDARAYWLAGAPHAFFYVDESGEVRQESVRLAANVLLWERAGVTFRLESDLSLTKALSIARSLR